MAYADTITIITDRFLEIVSAPEGADTISVQGPPRAGEHLFEHVPVLKAYLAVQTPEAQASLEGVPINGRSMRVEVHPAGDLLALIFSEHFVLPYGIEPEILDRLDPLILTDHAGRILWWNASARELLQLTDDEVLGSNMERLFVERAQKEDLFAGVCSHLRYVPGTTIKLRGRHGPVGVLLSAAFLPEQGGLILHGLKDARSMMQERERLQDINTYLETVIEESPIGMILVDKDTRVIRFNRMQEENSRIAREKVIGRYAMEVFPRTYENTAVYDATLAMLEGRTSSVSILLDHYYPMYYDKDMTFRLQARTLGNDRGYAIFCAVEEDLYREKRTAEKTAEELRQSKEYLASLLDASPNMVISVDKDRRILSFNRTAQQLLGYPAEQVYNTPVDRFFPADEQESLHEAVLAPGLWYGTFHIMRRDKTLFPIELYSTKIKDTMTARNVATLLISKDMEETDRLRQNLIQSQKMGFLGELMGSLAHQLNNPLVGVVNITDMLLRAQKDSDTQTIEHLRMIKEAGETCREVVSRLLKFSRRSEKNLHVLIDIRDVLNSGLDLLAHHALFRDITFKRELFEVPLIHGDPVLLQQAFMNILWNSAQASQGEGPVCITCSFMGGLSREVEVTIADKGSGISRENLARIFEPFFTTKAGGKGTGLGLSLAFWIVKDHGGRIEVDSEVGQGTRVSIHLPATSY